MLSTNAITYDSRIIQPPQFTSKYIDGTPRRTLSTLIHDINREKQQEDRYMCGPEKKKKTKTSKNQTFIQGASNQVITNKHRVALPPKSHLSNSNTSHSLHHISPRRRRGAVILTHGASKTKIMSSRRNKKLSLAIFLIQKNSCSLLSRPLPTITRGNKWLNIFRHTSDYGCFLKITWLP